MTQRVHFYQPLRTEVAGPAICGRVNGKAGAQLTSDTSAVTCERCIAVMARRVELAVLPSDNLDPCPMCGGNGTRAAASPVRLMTCEVCAHTWVAG